MILFMRFFPGSPKGPLVVILGSGPPLRHKGLPHPGGALTKQTGATFLRRVGMWTGCGSTNLAGLFCKRKFCLGPGNTWSLFLCYRSFIGARTTMQSPLGCASTRNGCSVLAEQEDSPKGFSFSRTIVPGTTELVCLKPHRERGKSWMLPSRPVQFRSFMLAGSGWPTRAWRGR